MLFHTWTFLCFFAAAFPLFRLIQSAKGKRLHIMICSFIFYGWWNPLYLLLISFVITLDFCSVYMMHKTGRRRTFLFLSITGNLTMLGFFKYANFIITNINTFFESAGIIYALPAADILLPVGISFYIFQSMSYTIDYYRGEVERETSIIQYAAYVSFFPQLVAGPIERASHLLPQMRNWPAAGGRDAAEGGYLFMRGVFKKIALADYFALYSDRIFANPAQYDSAELLLGALAFTWQIYFDFSGYTDMARGIAKSMGIDLMENFRLPYMAASIGEFWRRWHISLSSWFRDYVYKPLGGNRTGEFRTGTNIIITMLLSGLWHGAAWNFVLWGFIHGMLHLAGKKLSPLSIIGRTPLFIKRISVFIILIFTWIFFRAENANDAFIMIERIFTTPLSMPDFPAVMFILIILCYASEWLREYNIIRFTRSPFFKIAASVFMLIYLLFFASYGVQEFIYFQF